MLTHCNHIMFHCIPQLLLSASREFFHLLEGNITDPISNTYQWQTLLKSHYQQSSYILFL